MANITICPRHRDLYGTRWKCGKRRCSIPREVSGHTGRLAPRGDRRLSLSQAKKTSDTHSAVSLSGLHKKEEEGWALKSTKKTKTFSEKQKMFLEEKFLVGKRQEEN